MGSHGAPEAKYESVSDLLIEALELAVNEDLESVADDPVRLPPSINYLVYRPFGCTR
jgi:hypothetical protein